MHLNRINEGIAAFLEQAPATKKPPLLVVLGPTASGKTALSLELAERWNGEVISADSRQVYRGMDIGTDKISAAERRSIAHHLLDVADPSERFTVVDFMRLARAAIADIHARGKLPMLVGGTGLYINALTENFKIPESGASDEIRKKLNDDLREHGAEWLHDELKKVDPENAKKIHPHSYVYVLRALEIFYATGMPKKDQKGVPEFEVLRIGLRWLREVLATRIAARVEAQFERGLLDEVRGLLAQGYDKNCAAMRTLGYRETIAHLDGKISLEEAKKLIIKNTEKFSKRQMTWFKRDPRIEWVV